MVHAGGQLISFLAALAADVTPARTADQNRPARSTDPIGLTVPEVRHLLGALLIPANTSPRGLLRWSNWRRRHQAGARGSHHGRRLAEPSTG
ncbi:hypothetical protein H8N01_31170 [Streptomyces sp. AC536]|uniref:hypothetical protein n=1 Tax=Streptomyces buecherae TaxID=2763006 RepID=UPI00164DB48C|nr:hypothetical protein [Streptomyces buecherae]MBC3986927.1 hypothetical protein [Streptomyces buecherae]QNJ44821.1 hypothetical protein H7H31_28895 [Streptomyces buecherae]